MSYLWRFLDFVLHLDTHLDSLIQTHGSWVHGILFLIVFCETGFVVTPFLPGDSLLFAAGTFSARGSLNLLTSMLVLASAAILGDTVNYWIGHYVGPRVFHRDDVRWLNRKHLDRTHEFFEKYGAKTIILARFVPIVRTFAPFVAGIGAMTYGKFLLYNVVGGVLWVVSITLAGYFFGNIPVVRRNFTFVILGIIVVSVIPAITETLRHRRQR
ncbi:MAG: DedA family protein [Thermoanaerobaculum sp.]